MYSNLQISHVFKYGNRLSDLMKEKGVLEGPAFFAVRTKKNKKNALHFITPGTGGEMALLGYIFIEDLLNADIPFTEKLSDKFYFVA